MKKTVSILMIVSLLSIEAFANSICEIDNLNKSIEEITLQLDLNEDQKYNAIEDKRESFTRDVQACIDGNKQFRSEDAAMIINELIRYRNDQTAFISQFLVSSEGRAYFLKQIDNVIKSTDKSIRKIKQLTISDSN